METEDLQEELEVVDICFGPRSPVTSGFSDQAPLKDYEDTMRIRTHGDFNGIGSISERLIHLAQRHKSRKAMSMPSKNDVPLEQQAGLEVYCIGTPRLMEN
jgi:hypothetical protein